MAFNFSYFKGTTSSQAQNALHYWMNALQTAEDVERMKKEKEELLAENANELPRIQEGESEPEPANADDLSNRHASVDWNEQRE